MKIIFGLGNPGPQYSLTRHNIGFMVLDKLAVRWSVDTAWRLEKNCRITECRQSGLPSGEIPALSRSLHPNAALSLSGDFPLGSGHAQSEGLSPSAGHASGSGYATRGEKILLAKPQTYMNLSGDAAAALLNWYKITADDIIVAYDDTALPAGKIRLRIKGSSGGHRGIESLINCLGTNTFLRLKIGVGQPPGGWDLADYVLAGIGREEMALFDEALEKAADALECILAHGVTEAMNRFN